MSYCHGLSYGVSGPVETVSHEADLSMRRAEDAAYAAFVSGHECRFNGASASPFLSKVPRRHQATARAYFNMLEGNRLSAMLDPQVLRTARTLRQDAKAAR